jgi:hypothetical protein
VGHFWNKQPFQYTLLLQRRSPRRGGGRQQPHHIRKYKGGRKRHTMAAPSSPKIFMLLQRVLSSVGRVSIQIARYKHEEPAVLASRKNFEVSPTPHPAPPPQQISFCWKMECLLYVPCLICEKQRTLGKAHEIEACCYSDHLEEDISDRRKSTYPNAPPHIPRGKERTVCLLGACSMVHWLVTILICSYVFHHFRPTLMEGKGSMVKGGQRLRKHKG